MPQQVLQVVVTQHDEEAGLLWLQRAGRRCAHYTLKDLAELDGRLDAHLDGLRIAGAAGWRACLAELKWAEPGELFPAAILGWESGNESRVRTVIAAAAKSYECSRRSFPRSAGSATNKRDRTSTNCWRVRGHLSGAWASLPAGAPPQSRTRSRKRAGQPRPPAQGPGLAGHRRAGAPRPLAGGKSRGCGRAINTCNSPPPGRWHA